MHVLDRADVEAARRLRGDQQARVRLDLARQHDLLLIAARERPRRRRGPAAAHVVELDPLGRARHHGVAVEPVQVRDRRLVVVVQRRVLGDREVEHEAVALAILRDVPDAGVRGLARGRARHVDAVQLDAPGVRRRACRRAPGSARSGRCRRRPRCRRSRRRARPSRARAPRPGRDRRAPTDRAPRAPSRRDARRRARRRAAPRARPSARPGRARSRPRGRSSRPSCRAAAPRCGRRRRAPRAACA